MLIVSDTSPILNLVAIERLELLKDLYGSIVIPPAVSAELHDNGIFLATDWIQVVEPLNRAAVEALRADLDAGESEAIVLAQQLKASLLLIDERLGRRAATQLGLDVTELSGVLASGLATGSALITGRHLVKSTDRLLRRSDQHCFRIAKLP